ncbi:unnamed protein product [Allacma fusca]|uniref:Uncharacterized protein n=1 Tax=Allacma fusca TaxID=39272 RepID=A0A8J2KHF3_9HEXA|nr:unnamed protein product [Allacma fusca]
MKWQHVLGDGFSMKNVLEAIFRHENIPQALRKNQRLPNSDLPKKSSLHQNVRAFLQSLKAILLFPYESARFKVGTAGNEIKLWQKDANESVNEYHLTFTKPFRVEALKSVQGKFTIFWSNLRTSNGHLDGREVAPIRKKLSSSPSLKYLNRIVLRIGIGGIFTGKLAMGNAVSDMFALFSTPHGSADFAAIVTGSPNQVRFGLSLRKDVTSVPPKFIDIVSEYIEEEMEKLFKSVKN